LLERRIPVPHHLSKLIDLPAMKVINLFFLLIFGLVYVSAIAQQSSPGNDDDFAGVNARGDQGMGFSHEKTTHHFHPLADGGAIEIQSNEPTDAATQEAVRQHWAMIAVKFSQADFAIPMFIHATVPPGVETMKRLKSKITYEAENTERALRVLPKFSDQRPKQMPLKVVLAQGIGSYSRFDKDQEKKLLSSLDHDYAML
jgi:predicted Zn-dependent protease